MPIADLNTLDGVVVIGSNLRKDHPLMAQRLRQVAKHGARIILIDSYGEDPLFPVAARLTVAPSQLAATVAQVAAAVKAQKEGAQADLQDATQALAAQIVAGAKPAVLLGNAAVAAPDASQIAAQAQVLADASQATLGFLTSGANTVGAYLAGATAQNDGLSAQEMINDSLAAYIVLHTEPKFDMDNGLAAEAALTKSFSVALTSYKSAAQSWARVMLPVAPFTETSGTYVNAEGRAQSFKGVVPAYAQSRPAWKVLRVLGNLLSLNDFDYESSEAIREKVLACNITAKLNNKITAEPQALTVAPATGLERVAEVSIYRSDAIVRRAESLQETDISQTPRALMNSQTLAALQITEGAKVKVSSATGTIELEAAADDRLANSTVRIAQGFEATVALGQAFGQLTVERI